MFGLVKCLSLLYKGSRTLDFNILSGSWLVPYVTDDNGLQAELWIVKPTAPLSLLQYLRRSRRV
jgi:hypothetical protein